MLLRMARTTYLALIWAAWTSKPLGDDSGVEEIASIAQTRLCKLAGSNCVRGLGRE